MIIRRLYTEYMTHWYADTVLPYHEVAGRDRSDGETLLSFMWWAYVIHGYWLDYNSIAAAIYGDSPQAV
jgi:hypothetical protein